MSGPGTRRIRLAAGLGSVVLVLAGCGAAPERDGGSELEGKYEQSIPLDEDFDPNAHFEYANTAFPPGWDPIASTSGYDFASLAPVYDRLVYATPDGEIEPMLATAWESADNGSAIVFTLREGITFSDGTPFNAEAVKINLERAKGAGSRIAYEVAQLDSVEVIDEYTVKLTADTGAGALLGALAQRPGMMASPTAIAAGTLGTASAGTGPYVVTEFAPGASATFAKREGYWEPEVQRVATMRIRLMTDDQTRLNALQSGEVDGANIRAFQANAAAGAGIQVISRPTALFNYLNVNHAMPPLDDPRVREALNYAIDREAIGNGFYEGLCTPQIQPWPPSSFAYSEEIGDGLDAWPHDPEKAKELLAEAGYPDGFDMPAVTTNVTHLMQLSEILQEQLAEVGITMTISPVPTAQVREEFSINKTVAANVNPYSGMADPHGVAALFLLESAALGPGGPASPTVVQLATDASTPLEPDERAPLYHDMMQAMIDEPTHLMPICAAHVIDAYTEGVSGVTVNVSGFTDLRGLAMSGD